MRTNIETIEKLYRDFAARNMDGIEEIFADQIAWTQMEGFPNGGHYVGFEDIVKNVFQDFSDNWTNWSATVEEFLDAGDSVLAVGYYAGTYNTTGKSLRAAFIHRYTLKDSKVIRFVQYTDTSLIAQAMNS